MPETILVNNVTDQFVSDYTRYAIYTMYRRVLPDFRDGLTPVKRRIIYAMYADTKAVKSTVKCAAIVGDVMKKYHPHGDSSIYETLVPLANWFETNVPLVQSQGNFGNFLGDPPAHYRYTEAKLSKFGLDCVIGELQDTKNAVDWSLNYSQSDLEPDYLPVKVPLLLINGTFGICPGLRCEIPSHNMNEVIDATVALIRNPNLTNIILAPDHNMKCEIFNTDFAQISKVGFGHYTVRGVIKEEMFGKRQALVITSVPNLTFLESIKNRIDELIMNKTLVQIEEYFDESDGEHMRFIIVLKSGADPNYVKEVLYKNTKLEQTCRINFECLNGLHPYRMSYKAYLQSFIDGRIAVKYRYYANRLQDLQTKIHEREAYIKILESGEVDDVIRRIRKQKTVNDGDLAEYLMKRFDVTDLQAKYIINVNIKFLSPAYLAKFKMEAAEARVLIDQMKKIPIDDSYIREEIVQELLDIKKRYGHPRNCPIVNKTSASDVPSGMMTVAITENNFVKKVPMGANIGTAKTGFKCIISVDNTDALLAFDVMGRVFRIPVAAIPFTDKASNGMDIRFLCKILTADVCTILSEEWVKRFVDTSRDNIKGKYFLISLTKSGLIKRMDLDDFACVPKSGILYAKVDSDDAIKEVLIAHSSLDIIVFSDKKASRMNILDVPYLKRNTKGSRAMSSNYPIDGMVIINTDGTHVVVVTENGYVNKIDINALPSSMKGKSGFTVIKLNSGDRIKGVFVVNDSYILNAKTIAGGGMADQLPVEMIPVGSSISKGTKWISTRGNKIMHCYLTRK